MKPLHFLAVVTIALLAAAPARVAFAVQDPNADADAEAKYTQTIEKRAAGHVAALKLDDPAKSDRVQRTIVAHYRALREWHDTRGKEVAELEKAARDKNTPEATTAEAQANADDIRATLKETHDRFLSDLSKELAPQQVDVIKDEMTYNLVLVTYNAFNDMLPDLNAEQKAKIKGWLLEAREQAMDAGSSEQKHAVFGKYKGRINNYLSQQGYDLKKATKDWQERLKARRQQEQGTTTQPSK